MVAELAKAYATLTGALATSPLLNGRQEYLLPFQKPFNEDRFLHDPLLRGIADAYLGGETALDALTVVLAQAPIAAQGMHRDILEGPGAALSLQVRATIPTTRSSDHGAVLPCSLPCSRCALCRYRWSIFQPNVEAL